MDITLDGSAKTGEVYLNGKYLNPKRSQQVRNHSPDGFSWGYGGSGPAQLALAVLLQLTDEKTARANYQNFKWETIAALPFAQDFEIQINIGQYL